MSQNRWGRSLGATAALLRQKRLRSGRSAVRPPNASARHALRLHVFPPAKGPAVASDTPCPAHQDWEPAGFGCPSRGRTGRRAHPAFRSAPACWPLRDCRQPFILGRFDLGDGMGHDVTGPLPGPIGVQGHLEAFGVKNVQQGGAACALGTMPPRARPFGGRVGHRQIIGRGHAPVDGRQEGNHCPDLVGTGRCRPCGHLRHLDAFVDDPVHLFGPPVGHGLCDMGGRGTIEAMDASASAPGRAWHMQQALS